MKRSAQSDGAQLPLRIARPTSDLARARDMYCRGLGLRVLAEFENHDGFDGVMLGAPGAHYHFEFTRSREHPVRPAPTVEDLVVFYLPSAPRWRAACARMLSAGFRQVAAFNPYWERRGCTYEDHDGYRVVLQRERWLGIVRTPAPRPDRTMCSSRRR